MLMVASRAAGVVAIVIATAVAVADTLCRLQGPKGQWWWHYDVKTGIVAEEYPVFSVHQDGMAPMALLAIDEAGGTDHSYCIQKGLSWLNEDNELIEQMVVANKGVIWRDIHRREIGKAYRMDLCNVPCSAMLLFSARASLDASSFSRAAPVVWNRGNVFDGQDLESGRL